MKFEPTGSDAELKALQRRRRSLRREIAQERRRRFPHKDAAARIQARQDDLELVEHHLKLSRARREKLRDGR